MADSAHGGKGSWFDKLRAAAAFGFISMFVFIGDAVLHFLKINGKMCQPLEYIISNVANSHAPIKKTRIKGIPAPWMTSELSQLMHDRDYHHTKAVKFNSKHHWSKYRKLRQAVNKQVKECKASYYKDLIEKSSRNSEVDNARRAFEAEKITAKVSDEEIRAWNNGIMAKIELADDQIENIEEWLARRKMEVENQEREEKMQFEI
ncbi:hypothetical protein ACROYT_G013522 [Oculina patagonica]